MFDVKKLNEIAKKNKGQKIFIVGASIAALVASGDTGSGDGGGGNSGNAGSTSGDVTGSATTGGDTISIGSGGGVVDAGDGDDTITGGSAVDTIFGGGGVDTIDGGAGLDNLVVLGITGASDYVAADLLDVAGTGLDLSGIISLAQINGHTPSDVQSGESIDGGLDGAILYTFGAVDFTGVTLANITKIYLDNEVVLSDTTLQSLIGQGLTDLLGDGVIKAESGLLDLDGVNVPSDVVIKDSDGNVVLPEFEGSASIDVAENTTGAGTYIVSDASAVGDVTYALSGVDEGKFTLNSTTGELTFTAAPDYGTPLDTGADNIYDVIITATDEHQKSTTQDIVITVTNVNEAPQGVVTIDGTHGQGDTLTANVSAVTDADGINNSTITYQWLRNGDDISGANSSTYVLGDYDGLASISVRYSYTDNGGEDESLTSAAITDVEIGGVILAESVNGTNGFRINGVFGDNVGYVVSSAGDMNNDGFDDLLIGAPFSENDGVTTGNAYVLYGSDQGFSAAMSVADLNGNNGFKISGAGQGPGEQDQFGISVSAIGDANGDGYDDIIIGALTADRGNLNNVGKLVISYGQSGVDSNPVDQEFTGGAEEDGFSISISGAGDVNGDGYDDFIVGAPYADPNSLNFAGSSYVLWGNDSFFINSINSLTVLDGFRLNGDVSSQYSGSRVSGAGDVNGDGFDDLLIGVPKFGASETYLLFGKAEAFNLDIDISTIADGIQGIKLTTANPSDNTGSGVGALGDINGDGYADYAVGARSADNGGLNDSGSIYIMYGKADYSATPNINMATMLPSVGFRIDGTEDFGGLGKIAASAGDVNGDGFDDILVSGVRSSFNGSTSGSTYVIYGSDVAFSSVIKAADLDGTLGFRIDGADDGDNLNSISSAGDINGDGYDDIIVGATGADSDGFFGNGSAYIIYGGAHFAAVAQAATTGNDMLNGTSSADSLNGGTGNDLLRGMAGDDVLIGGSGTDTLLGGDGVDRMWGGSGTDSFEFDTGETVVVIGGSGNEGTIDGYDVIYDFEAADGNHVSEKLMIDGGVIIAADVTTVTGTAPSVLTVNSQTIKSHSIDDGMINFDDATIFGSALDLSLDSAIAATVEYLQLQDLGDEGTTVAFNVGSDTFIYSQGSDNGVDNSKDILVRLEGAFADSLITTNGTGEFDLFIA